MGVRLSGLMSNMDTDSIVEQLMTAQRTKVTKIENKKTKLTWTEEKWKDLNTKIYKLYTDSLSKMRLQSSYLTNTATSSNDVAVSVTANVNAPVGIHSVAVNQLASAKMVTGNKLENGSLTSSSNLINDLELTEGTVLTILSGTKDAPKKVVNFTVTATSTINDFTNACKEAGLNASFDTVNQRFYISSKNSGLENTFSITAWNGVVEKEGQTARNAIYDMFTKVKDDSGQVTTVELPINIKSQIDTYLNDYTFASDSGKEDIIENIYNLRVNYLKGKIQEEAGLDTPLTSEQLDERYRVRYESVLNKEATLEAIANQATVYSENYSLVDNLSAKTKLGIIENSSNTIDAQNSKIIYNGVLYEQASNTITINGLTIQAKQVTAGNANITITKNVQASYDMVKNFIKEYNNILKELNTLYYAGSARGYEPLTDEEKEAMTEDQIEKWETKIKDSLLRRDSTLGSLIDSMKTSMGGAIEVTTKNGETKKYNLSTLGINTSSDYTEKGLLHIYGDADDSQYAAETNKLMKQLEEDPEAVMQALTGISNKLYSTLTDKMKSTTLSSALTFYNDKEMTKQQTKYAKDISKLEDKLEAMESAYYKKFTAMETALAKLQQSTSALSSLMGNNN